MNTLAGDIGRGLKRGIDWVFFQLDRDALPYRIMTDDFREDGMLVSAVAALTPDDTYNVYTMCGNGFIARESIEHPIAHGRAKIKGVSLNQAVRLLDQWTRANEREGLERDPVISVGMGPYYKTLAQLRGIAL